MKYLIRFSLLLLIYISFNPSLFSQERPFKKFPGEEKIKLPHEKFGEMGNLTQTRVISKHYNADGYEVSEYIYQTGNGSSWENSSRTTLTYNISGLIDEYLYQIWDGTAWVNNYISYYTYNSNNLLTQTISQQWDGTAWQNN
jgi:hypothetical protein